MQRQLLGWAEAQLLNYDSPYGKLLFNVRAGADYILKNKGGYVDVCLRIHPPFFCVAAKYIG